MAAYDKNESICIYLLNMTNTIKVIQLEDHYVNRDTEYPYIHSIKSTIRFRLRSKLTFRMQPVLLVETLRAFDYLLPVRTQLDIAEHQEDFIVLKGRLTGDGAWEADLPELDAGVISFQLVFLEEGSTLTSAYGTHDVILLCQNKHELRKLRKMTVFGRCIGPHTEWESFFDSQHALGYNAFHFAPIQQTGASNSYYSLKCQNQLSDCLFTGSREQKNLQLVNILSNLKEKGIVFFIDIILNHTSFDSEWVRGAPDSVFTVENTPMLYTAFIVDQVIYEWGEEVKEMMSFDVELTQEILAQIEENLQTRINHLKLYEYFQLSQDTQMLLLSTVQPRKPSDNIFAKDPIQLIGDFLMANCTDTSDQRFGVTIKDIGKWMELNIAYEESDLALAIKTFNEGWRKKLDEEWIPEIVKNTIGSVKYVYFDNNFRTFDDPYPLVNKCFSKVVGEDQEFYAINNGWVGGADSRELFVLSKEYYYLRRRVNIWGDLLRVRYGERPADAPKSWEHMTNYVREMAQYFDGFRMDNLHGTQISVARYMIKQARKVNPNLIVFAELFTSSDAETAVFVKQIGINSVLKEAQHMLSGSEFVRQFHKKIEKTKPYLGTLDRIFQENGQSIKYSNRKMPIYLVYDLTHDNLSYIQKGIHILQTPISFAISLIGTFIGSTKGFDQFYNKKIMVTETRQLYKQDSHQPPVVDQTELVAYLIRYTGKLKKCSVFGSWDKWETEHPLTQHLPTETQYTVLYLPPGQYEYKFKCQAQWLLQETNPSNSNGNHHFTIQLPSRPKTIYRNLEQLRKSTSRYVEKYFQYKEYFVFHHGNIVVVIRETADHLKSICMIANLSTKEEPLHKEIGLVGSIKSSDIWLQSDFSIYEGLTTQSDVANSSNIHEFFQVFTDPSTGYDVLRASFLPAGFACLLQCDKTDFQKEFIQEMNEVLARPISLPPLGALEYNSLLYGAHPEEEHNYGQGNYSIPESNYKQLVYAGFAGVYQIILKAKRENKLEQGLFENLRNGDWLLNYYLGRLRRYKHMKVVVEYLENIFGLLTKLPKYLIPKYFTDFMYKFMRTIEAQNNEGPDFKKKLITASNQFINYFPNCPLPFKILISAGLPHFSVGWARCWGRDTFTSSDLLLHTPNIFRETIIQFASALRHGLIPNLLDQGRRPRYNCRDACWWFIRAIGEYIDHTKDYEILKSKVNMIFLSNDVFQHNRLKDQGKTKVLILEQVVQEIFQSHTNGISFREWNAGYEIDSNMTSDGFNISLQVDLDSGFIIGGNPSNCLTWMDKMGSSNKAGTKGVPATPRAGSPVQLVALLYHCLRTFDRLNKQGHYSFEGVEGLGKVIGFSVWADKIKKNFDYWYYLAERPQDESVYIRGIYKDLVGSPLRYDQQRFRPNALIAMAVAPDLFVKDHALSYLRKVEQHLIHPKSIGISTLASVHTPYNPFYDNSDDTNNSKIAHGFSYHNGPEWVWLYGFYLVAKVNIEGPSLSKRKMMCLLQEHIKYIQSDEWSSLPEITNKNGEYNQYSCHAQAWSISSILMALKRIDTLAQ